MRRMAAVILPVVLLLAAAGCGRTAVTEKTEPREETRMIKVNLQDPGQAISGFGTTGCWWSGDVGGWEPEKTDTIARLLFDKKEGIGLSIYRFEVGGGDTNLSSDPWRRAETFETAPGQYDWSHEANAVTMLKKAVRAGADNVMFFANTPPGRLTVSGKTTGGDSGAPNLRPGAEGEFARYLVDIALHFKAEGIPVKYISPINEPQWDWQESKGQEGCHYKPEQIVTVAEALTRELSARGQGIRPSLVDSGKWFDGRYTVELADTLAKNPVTGPAMDHFALHSYWSSDSEKKGTVNLLKQRDMVLPLWQTEWCQMEGGKDAGMDAALVLAKTVHEDLTTGGCAAWISWLAVSCYDYKDGLIYVNKNTRAVEEARKLWALGNYSRFIRPGYHRTAVEGDPQGLLTSAYASPDGKTVVLVAVNESREAVTFVPGVDEARGQVVWETSDKHALEKVSEGKPGTVTVPARAVTTVVVSR